MKRLRRYHNEDGKSPAIVSLTTSCARIFSRATSLPNVPRVYDAIASLHPGFPRIAGRDVINAPTLTSEKYTPVSSTLSAPAAPYHAARDRLSENGLLKKKAIGRGRIFTSTRTSETGLTRDKCEQRVNEYISMTVQCLCQCTFL